MARKTKTINVGLIGCNKRAMWYGAIFGNIDPLVYDRLDAVACHHMRIYGDDELQIKKATGFRLAKMYDDRAGAAKTIANAFSTKPEACKTLDEVSDNVDLVFIANESGDGRNHLKLAAPSLRKGVPTFIDRPFASRVKDAKAMIALTRRKRTPLLSCSLLRMLPHTTRFKARFAELEYVQRGIVEGQGPNPAHIADGIELALYLFGDEFGGRAHSVQNMGAIPLEMVHLRFVKGKGKSERSIETLIVNSRITDHRNSYWVRAMSMGNPIDSPPLNMFIQTAGGLEVMNAVKKMIQTGNPVLSYAAMLESVAVVEGARKAHNKSKPVPVSRLRGLK